MNAHLLKDLLWLLAEVTACGVVALAISTVLGVPAKYVPVVMAWMMIPCFVGYATWIKRRR